VYVNEEYSHILKLSALTGTIAYYVTGI